VPPPAAAELRAEKEASARAAAGALQQQAQLQQQLEEARSSKAQTLARCLQEAEEQKHQLQVRSRRGPCRGRPCCCSAAAEPLSRPHIPTPAAQLEAVEAREQQQRQQRELTAEFKLRAHELERRHAQQLAQAQVDVQAAQQLAQQRRQEALAAHERELALVAAGEAAAERQRRQQQELAELRQQLQQLVLDKQRQELELGRQVEAARHRAQVGKQAARDAAPGLCCCSRGASGAAAEARSSLGARRPPGACPDPCLLALLPR
jgi:fused signal recognition particle receptor